MSPPDREVGSNSFGPDPSSLHVEASLPLPGGRLERLPELLTGGFLEVENREFWMVLGGLELIARVRLD